MAVDEVDKIGDLFSLIFVYARSAFYDPRSLYYKCFVFILQTYSSPGSTNRDDL
jgi:hypothetical protein